MNIKLRRLGIFNYVVDMGWIKIHFYTRRGAVKFTREEMIRYMEETPDMTTREVVTLSRRYVEIGNHYDD
jgi:hypothetical protein